MAWLDKQMTPLGEEKFTLISGRISPVPEHQLGEEAQVHVRSSRPLDQACFCNVQLA